VSQKSNARLQRMSEHIARVKTIPLTMVAPPSLMNPPLPGRLLFLNI
jgi:hypothetical protein